MTSPNDARDPADGAPPLFTRYGFRRTGCREAPLRIEPYPGICQGGTLRATVLASAIDLVGGLFTREIAGTDVTFTSDLSLRIPAPGPTTALLARGACLRAGRRLVTTAVRIEQETADGALDTRGGTEGGPLYARGETTFVRAPRVVPEGGRMPDLAELSLPETIEPHPLSRPLDAEVGVESVDPGRGRVRLALRPALRNPEGVMQGALFALLAECAALARARADLDRPHLMTGLDLRYLAAASVGPVETRADWIGPASARMLHVEIRDLGREDRLTATAWLQLVPAIVGDAKAGIEGREDAPWT